MIAAGLPNRLFPEPEDEEDPKSPPEDPPAPAVPNREEPALELELEPNREEDCGLFSTTVEVVDVPNMEEEEEAGWC